MNAQPPARRKLLIISAVVFTFCALIALVLALLILHRITFQFALLSFVALLALYCGFGVLIAIYRFVAKLE